jgi:hypothetical protein
VADEIRTLLARHLPGYEVRSLGRLGEGLVHVSYEVNGELIVRKSREADRSRRGERRGEATRREAALLTAVAEVSTLPVPEPVFADVSAGVMAYSRLPGLPLIDYPVAEPAHLAPALGEFIGRLHGLPLRRWRSWWSETPTR